MRESMIHDNETPITEMMAVFLKLTQSNFDGKNIDLSLSSSLNLVSKENRSQLTKEKRDNTGLCGTHFHTYSIIIIHHYFQELYSMHYIKIKKQNRNSDTFTVMEYLWKCVQHTTYNTLLHGHYLLLC